MRPRAGSAGRAAGCHECPRLQLRGRHVRVPQHDPRASAEPSQPVRQLLLRPRARCAPVPQVRALRPDCVPCRCAGIHASGALGGEPRAVGGAAAADRARRHSGVREPARVLRGGRNGREGGAQFALLDARALDELARHHAAARRPPGGRARRGARPAREGPSGTAAHHELAQARAEPHCDRVRVSERRRWRRADRVGPERSEHAGHHLLRRPSSALHRQPRLRHERGTDSRVQDVLLVAAVTQATTSAGPAAVVAAPRWYAHGFNRAGVYRVATLMASALPRAARVRVAAGVAGFASRRFPAERGVVRRNLARILPGVPARELDALVAAVFRNFAVCFTDLITANRRADVATLVADIDGMTELMNAARVGRGLVVLTAHLGNWELAGRMLARYGARPTHVVVAAEADPAVERFLRGGEAPVRFVTRHAPTTSLTLLAALRRGEIVALQGDRALGTRGDVAHPFFGAPALFPMGPFMLARAARAPVVPAFCLLDDDRRYRIVVGTPTVVKAGGEAAALGRWVGTLETMVRRHPTQWFNFYDVWSPPA